MSSQGTCGPTPRHAQFGGMRSRRAVTLIELLVAIAIGSMVIAAVLGVLTSANRTQALGESRSDLFQGVRVSLRQVERDLQMAVTRTDDTDFMLVGTNEVEGDMPFDSLEVTTASGDPLTSLIPTGDLVRVQYLVDTDETTRPEGLVRTAMSLPLLEEIPPEQQELSARTYCPRTVGLDCMYYDATEQAWVEEWQERTDLPAAVRVTLYVLPEAPEEDAVVGPEDVLPFQTLAYLSLGQLPLGTGQVESEASSTGTGTTTGAAEPGGEPGAPSTAGIPPGMPSLPIPGAGGGTGLPIPGGGGMR